MSDRKPIFDWREMKERERERQLFLTMQTGMYPIKPYRMWTEIQDWAYGVDSVLIHVAFRVLNDGPMHHFKFLINLLDVDAQNDAWAYKLGQTIVKEMAKQPMYSDIFKKEELVWLASTKSF